MELAGTARVADGSYLNTCGVGGSGCQVNSRTRRDRRRWGVFVARHDRTALNVAGEQHGRADVPLDDASRSEAIRLGRVFAAARRAMVGAHCGPGGR